MEMEYVALGETGIKVSRMCLGTSRFGIDNGETDDGPEDIRLAETTPEQVFSVLDAADEGGINFIDTANVYGEPVGRSEQLIGNWLKDKDRERFVITSKVRHPMGEGPNQEGLSRKHIRTQIESTLDRLGTEYLDIYYLHRRDKNTALKTTLSTLDALVADGKIHAIGMSNYPAWEIVKARMLCERNGWEPPTVIQPPFNAIERPDEVLDACADFDLAVCGYRALCAGFLTGKYDQSDSPPAGSRGDLNPHLVDWFDDGHWELLDILRDIAGELEAMPAQVALRWLMEQDRFTCVPVVGARTPSQLRENIGAAGLELSADQQLRITEAGV